MEAIARLERLIGPPLKTPPLVNWDKVEGEAGLIFPDDFKNWAARYSHTRISNFLYIHHPGIYPEYAQAEAEHRIGQLREVIEDWGSIDLIGPDGVEREEDPFPLYPEPGGVYPWGSTDNGDYLLWLTDQNPEKWSIVVTDISSWWHCESNFIEFIIGLLDGSIRCPIFPDSFPGRVSKEEYLRKDLD
ncbi:SMI1/KNR4 family protein [Streptosporangium sandarakinum]